MVNCFLCFSVGMLAFCLQKIKRLFNHIVNSPSQKNGWSIDLNVATTRIQTTGSHWDLHARIHNMFRGQQRSRVCLWLGFCGLHDPLNILSLHDNWFLLTNAKWIRVLKDPTFKLKIKYVIGCWTRPKNNLVYTKEKCRVTMEFKVLKNLILKAYIIHWRGPMGFAVEEAKEVL